MLRACAATLGKGLLDLALPRVCLLCESLLSEQRGMVCAGCWSALPLLPRVQCARCGHPTYDAECRWCELLPDTVLAARSVCWVPDGVGGELVHKLKYGGWTGVAGDLAEHMARLPRPSVDGVRAVLVPVPLGAARRRERGYNQSAELARALAARWKVPVAERALVRVRETTSQVRLTHDERSANVHRAFGAGPAAGAIRGRHVIVIDDVVTTVATLNACAAAALAAGAHTISYVTFGRARAAFDRRPHSRSEPRWQSASVSTASAALAAKSSAPPRSGALQTSISSPSTT